MDCDILAFGIHPDDLEIGIFGTLANEVQLGRKIILVDLTAGEMGSNGNVKIREEESQRAAKKLGAVLRYQMGFNDRGLKIDDTSIFHLTEVIRKHKPKLVLYPYYKDYHPDHENGSKLIKEAIHMASLVKYSNSSLPPHKIDRSAMYYINDIEHPNGYVDISESMALKIECLKCHASQFELNDGAVATYLNQSFIEKIVHRDAYFGSLCNCEYAESLHFLKIKPYQSVLD